MNFSNIAHGGLAIAAQIVTALIAVAFGADFFDGAFGAKIRSWISLCRFPSVLSSVLLR